LVKRASSSGPVGCSALIFGEVVGLVGVEGSVEDFSLLVLGIAEAVL
jgi:hypothetical protein